MIQCPLTGSAFLRQVRAPPRVEFTDVLCFAVIDGLKRVAPEAIDELSKAKAINYFGVLTAMIDRMTQPPSSPEKQNLAKIMVQWLAFQLYVCFCALTSKLYRGEWSEAKVDAFFDRIYQSSTYVRACVDHVCCGMSDDKVTVYYVPLQGAPVKSTRRAKAKLAITDLPGPESTYTDWTFVTMGMFVLFLIACHVTALYTRQGHVLALGDFKVNEMNTAALPAPPAKPVYLALPAPPAKPVYLALPAPPAKPIYLAIGTSIIKDWY